MEDINNLSLEDLAKNTEEYYSEMPEVPFRYILALESELAKLRQVAVSEWHLFKDELPLENEDILVRNGIGKEVRRSKWKYSIYLNDLKKGMEWKRWADACC